MNLLPYNRHVNARVWSLPAGPGHCAGFDGKALACQHCYAADGLHWLPGSLRANAERAGWMQRMRTVPDRSYQDYVDEMVRAVGKSPYVVVHESGDFTSSLDVVFWYHVMQACPKTKFWVRTRTYRKATDTHKMFLNRMARLPNVVVRLSLRHKKEHVPKLMHSSTVSKDGPGCPKQQKGSCIKGKCRACWSQDVPNVEYKLHNTRPFKNGVNWPKFLDRQRLHALEV